MDASRDDFNREENNTSIIILILPYQKEEQYQSNIRIGLLELERIYVQKRIRNLVSMQEDV